MALERQVVKANDVRAPEVPRGTAIIVGRYRESNPKVALIHPADLAMLEASHEALQTAGHLEPLALSELALEALRLEDRADPAASVENADRLAAIFDR